MRALLLAALWVHLAASALLVGGLAMLLLAGQTRTATARRWEASVLAAARGLVLVALGAGIAWLLTRTALFENRPHAAIEPHAIARAVLETRPGLVWLARQGLLLVLGAFVAVRANVADKRDWIAARGEALALGALALGLMGASSHAAALSTGTMLAVASDVTHLLGSGVWIGGLVALIPLLRAASAEAGADARPFAVVAARRFSRTALITMLVLMASGTINALVEVDSIAGLVGTTYGRLLITKLSVLAPILLLALANRRRLLPALSGPTAAAGRAAMRRLAAFVGLEAALALALVAIAAAMTLSTPARHEQPFWPLPFRLSSDPLLDVPATRWRALLGSQLAVLGVVAVIASRLLQRRRTSVLAGALALVVVGAAVGLPPLVVDAYPTTYRRPPVTYQAASIASGMAVYRQQCAACHGPQGAGDGAAAPQPLGDLRTPPASRRHAGEIFWLVSHGVRERGMPEFASRLREAQRWDVINFVRALGAGLEAEKIGRQVERDRAWLIAPDFSVSVGPLAPGTLRDYRGRRMVLLVVYTLPGSRARMTELARAYDLLWVMGVEIIAVPTQDASEAIRMLGAAPPVLFPVVTEGAADIVTTYHMFARGAHAELLIDRQGYIRAIWSDETAGMPPVAALTGQVETLNQEKTPPPFPDDHVH